MLGVAFIHREGTLVGGDWSHKSTDSVSTFSHPLHSLSIFGGHYPRASGTCFGHITVLLSVFKVLFRKKREK